MKRTSLLLGLALALAALPRTAVAATLSTVSTDPFSSPTVGQHRSEVEPDTFAHGGTEVSAFQIGRIYDGGATAVGWSTTTNGTTWSSGVLPGITRSTNPAGKYDRDTDASVAYDASHNVWLIISLPLTVKSGKVTGAAVVVNRSTNGGASFGGPVTVSLAGTKDYDKTWIACDDTSTSRYYGHCYAEWDNNRNSDQILMSTSTNGGQTWSTPVAPSGKPIGLGGQPVVQPNGTVIVPASNAYESAIISYESTNGGATWGNTETISTVSTHTEAGNLRSGPLPSAEIDGSGKVYVVWEDCRFESGCSGNDIVMSTSSDGLAWSAVTRVPISSIGSGGDYFLPGIGVDTSTSGASAHIGLTYYYYPASNCTISTCQLDVGFVSSTNGGSSWSAAQQLAGPMTLSWLPTTDQGSMVGDYISTSILGGQAVPVFAVASAPSGSVLNQPMDSASLSVTGGTVQAANTAPRTGTDKPFSSVDNAAADRVVSKRG